MRVARVARGRSRVLIAHELLPEAACCIYMGVWGAYIRPPNRMHTSPFILITLKAPSELLNAPRTLKALSGINYSLKASSRLSPLLRACLSDSA